MALEMADYNGDGDSREHPKAPEDAQAEYIRKLEDRLAALEKRIATVEAAKPEQDASTEAGDGNAEEGKAKPKHPPFPSTIAEVRSVNVIQAFHHDISAPSMPAIEFMCFSEKGVDEDPKLTAFKRSFEDLAPGKALEVINTHYAKPFEMDMASDFAQIRILSMPLSQVLWPIICGEKLTPNLIAVFTKPWALSMYRHSEVRNKLEEMEKGQISSTEAETPGSTPAVPKDTKLLDELRAYVKLMEGTIMPYYEAFKKKTSEDNLKVYFDDLWHLFEPGEVIYYPEARGTPSKADYDKLQRSKRPDQKLWKVYQRFLNDNKYWVKAYCIDYDGESYVCVKEWFSIEKFEGRVSANSLKVYPVRFAPNGKKIMEDALEGGKGFMKNLDAGLLGHNGWCSIMNQDDSSLIHVSGDVVIDFAETFRAHPDWKPISMVPATYYPGGFGTEDIEESKSKWYWAEDQELKGFNPQSVSFNDNQVPRMMKKKYIMEKDRFLSSLVKTDSSSKKPLPEGDDLYLLPNRVFGYSLQDRRFIAVNVKNLREIEDNRDKFKNLVINPDHEGMLRALVESHFRRKDISETTTISTTNQDIVQNKGRGLVILLHGVPGVGKTSTAEMIASNFQRPLLPITCGDLGLDPAAVEKSLKQMFRVAQLWDCILLLDEADVFLSERVSSDLSRNALVSVFLRVLDYYSGILFLTTNRVGTIDEAFKSRIHISLYYPYLDLDQTEKIWAVNLDRLAVIEAEQSSAQKPLSIDRDDILTFAKRHYEKSRSGKGRWNGRQIRNAFLIASALAHYEKTHGLRKDENPHDLTARHFRTVVKAGTGFEKYLLETRGMTDQEAAYLNSTRADHVLTAEGGGNAPRTPAPTSAQPVKPPMHPAWANQYPSQQPFTPPRNPSSYNLAHHSPANSLYPQQPPPQHYVYETGAPPETFGQPPMVTGYPPRALTPGAQPQPPSHPQGWNLSHNTHHPPDYDSDI